MVEKIHRWSNLIAYLFSIVLIAVCVLADNYIDISHHLEQGTGSVFYYYFGSIVFGGLYGVYFAPSFSVLPWCVKRDDSYRISQKLARNVISSGITLAGGFFLLFCALRIKMPLVADYEKESIIEAFQVGQAFAFTESIALGNEVTYFIIAIWFVFLIGCLSGAFTSFISIVFRQSYLNVIAPTLMLVCMAYGSKYLGIPNEYRLDRWLLMRNVFNDSLLTIACASFSVAVIVIVLCLLCAQLEKNRRTMPLQTEHKLKCCRIVLYGLFSLILYLATNSMISPVVEYSNSIKASLTPVAFPFISSDSCFQMIYMIFFICIISSCKPLVMDSCRISTLARNVLCVFLKILFLSILFCTVSILFSFVAMIGNIDLNMEWGKTWMSLAMERYSNMPFDVPLSFVQTFTPLQAVSFSACLTIFCSFSLCAVCVCCNYMIAGLGSIVVTSLCFLDITAYNLAENALYKYSPLSWAQSIYYHSENSIAGYSIFQVFFIYGIIVLVAMTVTVIMAKQRSEKRRV